MLSPPLHSAVVSLGQYIQINPQLILVCLSFQDLILSSIISPDNLHLDLVSCFQSLYPINNRFNLFILLFQKESLLILCCFINQHHQMLSSSMLGFLIDEMSKYILLPGFSLFALTSSGFLITILAANKTELPAFKTLSKMIGL